MERQNLMALIAEVFDKGEGSFVVVNKSADSCMNKGRGANRNPFLGRVILHKEYSGYVMGTDYKKSIENTADRMGNSDAEAKLRDVWHKRVDGELGDWFSTDKATESKIYLKLQRNAKQVGFKTTETYYVDGHAATDEELSALTPWLKSKNHTQSSTQIEMGIDKEHEQYFILPQLETIVLIKQGEREIRPCEALREVYAAAYAV